MTLRGVTVRCETTWKAKYKTTFAHFNLCERRIYAHLWFTRKEADEPERVEEESVEGIEIVRADAVPGFRPGERLAEYSEVIPAYQPGPRVHRGTLTLRLALGSSCDLGDYWNSFANLSTPSVVNVERLCGFSF